MGTFQNVVLERTEQFGHIGSRTGSGHRPARHFHAALPVAQQDTETFTFDAATTYTVGIDGIDVVVDGGDVADLAALVDAFIDGINEHPQISQIVAATLDSAGVMALRARESGNAYTLTESVAGGAGSITPASVQANVAGTALDAGDPVFQPANATNPRLVQLPSAATDVFVGVVQFRHRAGDLSDTPAEHSYPAGEQVPVDPDGPHIGVPAVDVEPGDQLTVRFQNGTVGELSNVSDGDHIDITGGRWQTSTTAGNKGTFTYDVA